MRKGLIISGLGLISILSFISLYIYVKSKEIKLEYNAYNVIKLNNQYAEVEVLLSVFNPFLVDISLKRLKINVFIGDKFLSHLSESNYTRIKADSTSIIPIRIHLNWSDIQGFTSLNSSNTQLTGGVDQVTLKGNTSVRVLGLGVNDIPVFAEFNLNEFM